MTRRRKKKKRRCNATSRKFESIAAYRLGLIPRERFLDFLDRKPEDLELVLTGRDAPEELKSRADYVSEIVKRKHPFDKGIPAREGVEF